MASLNHVMLIGRLGKDPEIKYSKDGNSFGSLSIATEESYKNPNGEWDKKTEWHKVAVSGKMADNCSKYLSKGSLVYVEGSLKTVKYTDKSGNAGYFTQVKATKVLFIDSRGGSTPQTGYAEPKVKSQPNYENDSYMDEMPF